MMRGPSYDDAYISRKMSHLHGPTFSAPGPVSYGRPPIGGYMQEPYGYDYVPRRRLTNTTRVAEARSLSPELPYLWPELDNNLMERKSRKGWYRVDFGPQQSTELRYLPTTRDKLNFLRRYSEPISDSSYQLPRATSVPPPVRRIKSSRTPRSSSYWTTLRYRPITSTVVPYTRPRSTTYSYWYYPTLGPYWSRLWTSPRYLNPIAGRARSLSPPIRVSTSWSDTYTSPYSSYSATTTYSPDSTEVREERRSVSPAPSSYRPSAATQLILNRVALRAPHRTSVSPLVRGYPPLGPPPPRMVPRMPPAYYDYDYGYGGYYGYAPPPPRISRYDSYLDDDLPEPSYIPRYRPRVPDTLDDADFRERSVPHMITTTTTTPRTTTHTRGYSPGMLQDHVDKMRIRLKSLAYSLDPTGPVPEIILPERHKKSGALDDKKYSSALEFRELPKLASRRQRYYPEDEHMKDNLRIQCLSHYKTTRTAADAQVRGVMPDTTSRYTKLTSKWEEPDTVFGAPTDKKPFSKAITDGTTEEGSEERKERRKKKKSKERELAPETSAAEAPAPADHSEVEPVSAPTESEPAAANGEPGAEDDVLDDKERKRLEKKKRKAEREAAAKAAMEAELAALAAAEAELARLEAESSSLKPDAPAPVVSAPAEVAPAPAEPAAEVKSESAAEKCESSTEVVCEVVCVTPETLGELAPSKSPLQVPPQEEQVSQVTEEPQAIQEPQRAEEPSVEPQVEPLVHKPQVEEPQLEAPVEPPVEVPPLEEAKAEELQMKPSEEVPQAKMAQVEEPQVEEPQVEPPVEEPQVVEPQTEPPVEARMEAAYVEESVAVVEEVEEPRRVARRAAGGDDDDAGWLDAWAGEAAAAAGGAAEETGPHLGTEVSGDLATTTIRAEAGQEEPDAAAAADDAAADAATTDTLTTGAAPTRLGDEPLQ